MRYIFITWDGYPFPIAKHLQDEGNEVLVSMIENPKLLKAESFMTQGEDPEEKRRRLSIYDGVLNKIPLPKLLKQMQEMKDKDDCYVFLDFNNLFVFGDVARKMGFTKGQFPTKEDFEREKDRQGAKEMVKKHFPGLKVAPVHEFSKVDDAIEFLSENEGLFALKSNGNYADTTIPQTSNEKFAKEELVSCLRKFKKDWEKGSFTLEQKIENAIEVAPQMAFWNGEPIYSHIEFETRLIGSGEIGLQTGGIQNLMIATKPSDAINELAFPPIVYEIAKKRKGLFLFDAGILFDPRTGDAYFTEFAGNRYGWGGAFSEISMARSKDKIYSNYFEQICEGKNPQTYRMGSNVALYNLDLDSKFPGMHKEGIAYRFEEEIARDLNLIQVRKDKKEGLVNTALNNTFMNLLGYHVGYGNSLDMAVDRAYRFENKLAFNGLYYRPKFDFLSEDYVGSIPNRFQYLLDNGWIEDDDSRFLTSPTTG